MARGRMNSKKGPMMLCCRGWVWYDGFGFSGPDGDVEGLFPWGRPPFKTKTIIKVALGVFPPAPTLGSNSLAGQGKTRGLNPILWLTGRAVELY